MAPDDIYSNAKYFKEPKIYLKKIILIYFKSLTIKLIFKINCTNLIEINILMMYHFGDPKIF